MLHRLSRWVAIVMLSAIGASNAYAQQLSFTEDFQRKTDPIRAGGTFTGTGTLEPMWLVNGSETAHVQVTEPGKLLIKTKGTAAVVVCAIDLLQGNGATDFDVSSSPLTVTAVLSAEGADSAKGMLSAGLVIGGLKIETWPDLNNGTLRRVYSRSGTAILNDESPKFSAVSSKPFTVSATLRQKDNSHYILDFSFDSAKQTLIIAKSDVGDIGSVGVYLEDLNGGTASVHSISISQPVVPAFDPLASLRTDDAAANKGVAALRLVPFPKKVELQSGVFSLDRPLTIEAPASSAVLLGNGINEELRQAGYPAAIVRTTEGDAHVVRISAKPAKSMPNPALRENAVPEEYALVVQTDAVVASAADAAGLFHAVQTLRQLIRANRHGATLPCLDIHDWPSLRWRAFQDDMTRGPSAKLDTLKREADLGGFFKMNLLAYYMEFQYAFPKHPVIGPKDGSLTPEELKALVEYAKPRQIDILGSQQSFGHCGSILSHPEYAALRETSQILAPVKEETYQLLDDLYSGVVPLLPCPWFNVCCDETAGLGEGPAKDLAKQLGIGGVYARHMRRVHDLLKDKYGKRMMMWGDIILQHPDKLDQIPKDTIMLTWGYEPMASFEGQITPFVKAGYEFFVCPGVDDWGRILPDFGSATINIRNFVRDGVKHHALGMLNTEWKDDACTLRSPAWHGYAWGAECAWSGSTTEPDDFNRRLGAVLFGEKSDHFGMAIGLLSKATAFAAKTDNLPHWESMNNAQFWKNDFVPRRNERAILARTRPLLAWIRLAIEHLEACKKDAVVNADLLDAFLLGARRMELLEQRMVDGVEAANNYAEAVAAADKDTRLAKLAVAERLAVRNREAHRALGEEFARLWHTESKPYAIERSMNQFAALVKWYDDLALKLTDARKQAEAGKPLPSSTAIGLSVLK